MRAKSKPFLGCAFALLTCSLWAQDLAPRAYLITPVNTNAVTLTWSFFNGGVNFNGAVPITGATGTFSVPTFTYYHAFNFFGRSANVAAYLPYGVGTFEGEVQQQHASVYRSGLMDSGVRLSVNLKGGPAMPAAQFTKWKQKMLLGASIRIVAPTGQYDPHKIVIGESIAGPSSRSLAIPNVGGIGCWMPTRGSGSTPQTRQRLQFPHPKHKRKHPSAPWRRI